MIYSHLTRRELPHSRCTWLAPHILQGLCCVIQKLHRVNVSLRMTIVPIPLTPSPLLIQSKRGQYQHWKVLGNANRRHSGLKQFSPHRRSSDSCFENSHCYSPEVKRWSVEVSLWERKGIAEV